MTSGLIDWSKIFEMQSQYKEIKQVLEINDRYLKTVDKKDKE